MRVVGKQALVAKALSGAHDLSGLPAHGLSALGRLWEEVDAAGEVVAGNERFRPRFPR